MTELERLLTQQLQQAQLETAQMQSQHKAEVVALQEQLSGLKSAWEHSATSYSTLFNEQQKSMDAYKQQIETDLTHSLKKYKQQIESALQETLAAHQRQIENGLKSQREGQALNESTLSKVENSLLGLTMQLNGLTKQLKR